MLALISLHDPRLIDWLLLGSWFFLFCGLGILVCFLSMDDVNDSGDAEIDALLQDAWDSVSLADPVLPGELYPDGSERSVQQPGTLGIPTVWQSAAERLWGVRKSPLVVDLWGDIAAKFVDVSGFVMHVFAKDLEPEQIAAVVHMCNDKRCALLPRSHFVLAERVGSRHQFRGISFDHMTDLVAAVSRHFEFPTIPEAAFERGTLLEFDLRAYMQPVLPARVTESERQYRRTQRTIADPVRGEQYKSAKRQRDASYNAKRYATRGVAHDSSTCR
jgi:hypothetical protein